jgi:uncharacterized protein (TIGR03067 family)
MRRVLLSSIAAVVVALAASVAALQPAGDLASLQGRWVVTGGEHNGQPMDSLKGGVMTIAGSGFEIRTASGNQLKGTLRVDTSHRPLQMDMNHADGTRWLAVYEVDATTLRLNYVDARGKDPRPAAFTTSEATEESIVTLRRDGR